MKFQVDARSARIIVAVGMLVLAVSLTRIADNNGTFYSMHGGALAPSGSVPAPAGKAAGDNPASAPKTTQFGNTIVGQDTHHDVSPPLRDIVPLRPPKAPSSRFSEDKGEQIRLFGHVDVPDAVTQSSFGAHKDQVAPAIPATLANFSGIASAGGCNGCAPPDTNGDVGPNHYVQTVNTAFQVFSKTGASLYGPANINTIWSGFGGPCQTQNDGDPVVLYDPMADRWLVSQFTASSPYNECIAISSTPDPTGTWNRYAFQLSTTDFPDYPKFGVWPDGYYMTVNWFTAGQLYGGPRPYVFNRSAMLNGTAASFQTTLVALGSSHSPMLPADLDGPTLPTSDAPNPFVEFGSMLNIWKYHVDWTTPANSSFTNSASLSTAAFTQLCSTTQNCVPQQGTTQKLDGLGDRLMNRLAYRKSGSTESMVVTHNVSSGGVAGVRWYEIRNPNGTASIYQQGTYQPDTTWRWMGSAAMDSAGNIGVGYSASSGSLYPSIRYTGRLVGDALGTLPQGEGTIYTGTGYQSGVNRWGDYANMSVDPADDCTFWFTTEYNASGAWAWSTKIASFKFPSCGASTPTVTSTSTSTPTNTPTTTNTPTYTATPTATRSATNTPTFTRSATPVATATDTPTATPANIDAYAYFSPVGPLTVQVGSRIDLDLRINAGTNSITAAQHYLTFTNSILQNVNVSQPDCVISSTVTIDNSTFDAALQNEVCNGSAPCDFGRIVDPAASISFASGALNNCPSGCVGDFRVARLAFCAVAVGDALLHWEFAPPAPITRASEVIDVNSNTVSNPTLYTDYVVHVIAVPTNTPTATATPTSTSTPTPTSTNTPLPPTSTSTATATSTPTATFTPVSALIIGHVTLEGRGTQPNARQSVPITVTLRSTSGGADTNYSTTTDASGFFTVTAPGPDTYNYRVKNPQTFANSGAAVIAVGTNNIEMGLLREGDATNDNCINVTDFSITKSSFGHTQGQAGYDPRADFTGDTVVNASDFNLLRSHFGQCGALPITPAEGK